MNIAIDGYEANVANRVGIGRYAYEILVHLYPLASRQNVTVFLPSTARSDMPAENTNWHYKIVGPARLWTFVGLPLALRRETFDVVFSPTHYIPRFITIPRVMSIMDVSYLEYPAMFRKKDLYQLTTWTAYSVHKAAKILTISEFSKNAIIKAYGVNPEKIAVTYPGLTMKTATKKSTYTNYILTVGTLQPRKNYVRLIEAFSKLDSSLTLVIVGKKGWLYEDILAAPEKFGVQQRVKFLEFVPDSDLSALYKDARCFVLPSLYEGFGLPVLEAMAYGCPVVVSNVSSLPEIAGKAGIYVDPTSIESIAKGLREGLSTKNTEAARRQVKKFSWEKAAQDTLKVLEEVGKK